jgi:hypothetical protein
VWRCWNDLVEIKIQVKLSRSLHTCAECTNLLPSMCTTGTANGNPICLNQNHHSFCGPRKTILFNSECVFLILLYYPQSIQRSASAFLAAFLCLFPMYAPSLIPIPLILLFLPLPLSPNPLHIRIHNQNSHSPPFIGSFWALRCQFRA